MGYHGSMLWLVACTLHPLTEDDICGEAERAVLTRTLQCTDQDQSKAEAAVDAWSQVECPLDDTGTLSMSVVYFECIDAMAHAPCSEVQAGYQDPQFWLGTEAHQCPRVFRLTPVRDTGGRP